MAELMAVPVGAGGALVVEVDPREVDPREAGSVKAGRAGQAVGAAQTLQAALASVVPAAAVLLAKLGEVKPSQICAAGGLKLAVQAGAVVTKTAGERGCVVRARWWQAWADG